MQTTSDCMAMGSTEKDKEYMLFFWGVFYS